MQHRLTAIERRIVDFTRISDEKVFPAEVRAWPNRFVESMEDEVITVAWQNSENAFSSETATLTWKNDTSAPWDWSDGTFTCTFVIPEVPVDTQTQTPRGVSPITIKGASTTITTTK